MAGYHAIDVVCRYRQLLVDALSKGLQQCYQSLLLPTSTHLNQHVIGSRKIMMNLEEIFHDDSDNNSIVRDLNILSNIYKAAFLHSNRHNVPSNINIRSS